MIGIAKNTVTKLLVDIGRACSEYQDKAFRNLKCKRIQCDEIWSFVGSKAKNTSAEKKAKGNGDCWTWTALCPDTKLIPCWFVGDRSAGSRMALHARPKRAFGQQGSINYGWSHGISERS